jgi:hypothetical protein
VARDPSAAVGSEPTASDDAVYVRVIAEIAAPGMEHSGHAELAPKASLIATEFEQSTGCG